MAVLAWSLATGAAPSQAAQYTVTSCPATTPVPAGVTPDPFLQSYRASTVDDGCAAGTGLGLQLGGPNALDGESVNGTVGFQIAVPATAPNATIAAAQFSLTVAGKTGDAASAGAMSASFDQPNANRTDLVSWLGGTTNQIGPVTETARPVSPSRLLFVSAHCGSRCTFGQLPDGSNFFVRQLSLTLNDNVPPAMPGVMQPPASGIELGTSFAMPTTAADADSGVASVRAYGDASQTPIWSWTNPTCAPVRAAVCSTNEILNPIVDTTALGAGLHTVRIAVTDYAGNTTEAISTPFTVTPSTKAPAPGPSSPLNGAPKGQALVTSGSTAKKAAIPSTQTTTWRHKTTLRGRLLAADGTPMPGAQLDITQTIALPGAVTTRLATITTDAKGAYSYVLRPTASATYEVAYPLHVGFTDYSAARTLKLAVGAGVTLKRTGATRRGARSTFSGRVLVASIPAEGVNVAIQYHSPTSGWRTTDVVTAGASGKFTWRYAFRTATKYRIRARVVPSKLLANAAGVSPEVRFTIR